MATATMQGLIVYVDANNDYIFIRPYNNIGNDVYFYNRDKMNLRRGWRVCFGLDDNDDDKEKKGRKTAKWIDVVDTHNDYENDVFLQPNLDTNKQNSSNKKTNKSNKEWMTAIVEKINQDMLIVKPNLRESKTSLLNKSRIEAPRELMPMHIPPILVGDALRIQIMMPQRPKKRDIKVCKVKLCSFQPRSLSVLLDYVKSLLSLLASSQHRDSVMLHIVHVRPLWIMIFNENDLQNENKDHKDNHDNAINSDCNEDDTIENKEEELMNKNYSVNESDLVEYSQKVLSLMHLMMLNCGQIYLNSFKFVIELYLRCNRLITLLNNGLEEEGSEKEKKIFEFTQLVSYHFVEFRASLKPLLPHLSKMNLLKIVDTLLSLESSDLDAWHLTPILPDVQELLEQSTEMWQSSKLGQFSVKFENCQVYLEHFYRLMRANAFHLIQSGLRKFKSNNLDPRDLLLFKGITLRGIHVDNNCTHLMITFDRCLTRRKLPTDFSTSSMLKIGSLLCLLLSYNQMIWAIVSDRDCTEMKKWNMIGIELLSDFNRLSLTDTILRLSDCNSSQIFMAESPTLFPSVGPILETLKHCRLDEFVLKSEIVEAQDNNLKPKYLKNPAFEKNLFEAINNLESSLDEAQFNALKQVFEKRLSIVQGPPGCGKTFLGVKIVELFLKHCTKSTAAKVEELRKRTLGMRLRSMSKSEELEKDEEDDNEDEECCEQLSGLVLVVTYKNHALDEFLKHIKETPSLKPDWTRKLARIGGRSSEPELECINLRNLSMEAREEMRLNKRDISKYANIEEEFFDARNDLSIHRGELNSALEELIQYTQITPETFYYYLDESQVMDLLHKTPWSALNIKCGPKKRIFTHKDIQLNLSKLRWQSSGKHLELIQEYEEPKNDNQRQLRDYLVKALVAASRFWWPSRSDFNTLFSRAAHLTSEPNFFTNEKDEEDEMNDDEMEQPEMDQVHEILDARLYDSGNNRKEKDDQNKEKDKKAMRVDPFWMPEVKHVSSNMFDLNDMGVNDAHTDCNLSKLTKLTGEQKVRMILTLIARSRDDHLDNIRRILSEIRILHRKLKSLETEKKFQVLKNRSVIGVTITGAAINSSLLRRLNPTLVVVEEAAEILEPALVAALTSQVQHLVLIGDHKQLRPQVESFELVRDYHLDTSMMERLIQAGYPYAQLRLQSRMRPEFAELMRDIYPDYTSNMERVAHNEPLTCLEKEMFVWSHNFDEDSANSLLRQQPGRSKINAKEADMVVALALFILAHEPNIKPSQITILASYRGQVQHIRHILSRYRLDNRKDNRISRILQSTDEFIDVSTIDNFQGDENDFIIVSLVRANPEGKIGFNNSMNRRCVAQSRAKRGMYFVCNTSSLCKMQSKVWPPFINNLRQKECVGQTMAVKCPRHSTKMEIQDTETMLEFAKMQKLFCNLPCDQLFNCQIKSHACKKPCSSCNSHHTSCMTKVDFVHRICGHGDTRFCHEDVETIKCKTTVHFTFNSCGHPGSRKCHEEELAKTCKKPCPNKMENCDHFCTLKCGQLPHEHNYCPVKVNFVHPCGHQGRRMKECSAKIEELCKEKVEIKLSKCGHIMPKLCFQKDSDITCTHPCKEMNDCGKHQCRKRCGEEHNHNICTTMIDYVFPDCGHPSPQRKKCSEQITWKCSHIQYLDHPKCGHKVQKQCFETLDQVICPHLPCPRKRPLCGHECLLRCGEDCSKSECRLCTIQFEGNLRLEKAKMRERIRKMEKEIKKRPYDAFKIEQLRDEKDTKSEYMEIYDTVMTSLKEEHKFYPNITAIRKVSNLKLLKNFNEALLSAFDEKVSLKFHGTSDDGVNGITKQGFRLPKDPGMYGKGIYFATNSSKSAREIYTKGSVRSCHQ